MIINGTLTHAAPESALSTLQFTSPAIHGLLVAVLTTLLSYQATAIIFDLVLGLKPRGFTTLTDVFTLHFSERLSLLAALPDLCHSLKLASIQHHGLRCGKHIAEQRGKFSSLVTARVLLLLLCVPLINLLSIILSLESDSNLTFGQANFGGLALGLTGAGGATQSFNANGMCRKFLEDYGVAVTNTPDFFLCGDYSLPTANITDSTVAIRITKAPNFVSLEIEDKALKFSVYVNAPVRIRSQRFTLRPQLSDEETQSLWLRFSNILKRGCGSSQEDVIKQHDLSEMFRCKFLPYVDITRIMGEFQQSFTVISTKELKVSTNGREFRNGEDLLLLTRRRPYLSLIGLMCTTVAAVFLRIVTKQVTNNDVDLALEIVFRKGLGVRGFDSMLHCTKIVKYCGDVVDESEG